MADDFRDNDELIDPDPAMDFIIYDEMSRQTNSPNHKGGCLGIILLFLLPLILLRVAGF
jgi:hypothetical protein